MNSRHPIDRRGRLLSLLTATLLAVAAIEASFDLSDPPAPRAPAGAVFTGEIAPDGPVYRLPPVHVVADRKTELARIEREEQAVRSGGRSAAVGSAPDARDQPGPARS